MRRTKKERRTERSVEERSVARRREPSWRVAATNGLMNLMEASRHRVAGELRTEVENNRDRAKEERRKWRPGGGGSEREGRKELDVAVVVDVVVVRPVRL